MQFVTDKSFPKISRRGLLVGAGALAATGSRPARAVLNIDINQGNVQPMPIALPDFLTGGPTEGDIGRKSPRSSQQSPARRPVRADQSGSVHRKDFQQRWRAAFSDGRSMRRRWSPNRITAERRAAEADSAFGRVRWPATRRQAVFHNTRQLASHPRYHFRHDHGRSPAKAISRRIVFVDETGAKDRRVKRLTIAGSRRRSRALSHAATTSFSPRASIRRRGNHLYVVWAG
jgi:TolB protein